MAVEDLLSCFLATGVHAAPVLDGGGRLVGFVSLADLVVDRDREGTSEEVELRIGLREGGSYDLGPGFHLQSSARTVADVMTTPAVHLHVAEPLARAAAVMAFEGLQHLPIVGAGQRVVGILSAHDVMRWLAQQDGYCIPAYTQRTRWREGVNRLG